MGTWVLQQAQSLSGRKDLQWVNAEVVGKDSKVRQFKYKLANVNMRSKLMELVESLHLC